MIFLIDFDGVLTNGKVSITADGSQLFKEVHTRDIRAIRQLVATGNEVYIVTASSSPIINAFADKVGAIVISGRDKAESIKSIFESGDQTVAVGDDSWDISMLKDAHKAFCPADAYHGVRSMCCVTTLQTKGGEGVVAELLDIIYTI